MLECSLDYFCGFFIYCKVQTGYHFTTILRKLVKRYSWDFFFYFFNFLIFNKKDEKSQFELTQMSFYREIHMISQSC